MHTGLYADISLLLSLATTLKSITLPYIPNYRRRHIGEQLFFDNSGGYCRAGMHYRVVPGSQQKNTPA